MLERETSEISTVVPPKPKVSRFPSQVTFTPQPKKRISTKSKTTDNFVLYEETVVPARPERCVEVPPLDANAVGVVHTFHYEISLGCCGEHHSCAFSNPPIYE